MIERIKSEGYLKSILLVISVICYGAVIYTTLTYGRVTINSDVSLVSRFYDAVVNAKSIYPTSWNAVNGEIYAFTRLPVNVLMLAIIKDRALAIVISNCIVFSVSIASVVWFSKRFVGNDFWLVFVPLFSVFLCGKEARVMIFLHGAYCGFVIIFTLVLGLFWINIVEEKKTFVAAAVHGIILFLMILGGKRHIAEYLLPTIATGIIYLLFIKKGKDEEVEIFKNSVLKLAVPSALGYGLYMIVCSSHNMNFGSNSSLGFNLELAHIWENIRTTFGNLITIFGYDVGRRIVINCMIIIICLMVCIVFPILQAIEWKKMNEREQIFFIFVVMHNAEILLVVLLCDMLQTRYMLSSVFLLTLVSSNYFYKKLVSVELEWLKISVLCGFFLVSVFFCRDLLKLTIDWQEKFAAEKSVAEKLVSLDVKKGYATFWNGYPNEVFSNGKLTFGGVDISEASFMKQYSNCDSSCYEYKAGKCCVILSDSEVAYLQSVAGENFISTFVAEPVDKVEFDNPYLIDLYGTQRLTAYIFDKDVCDRLTDGLKDGVLEPREMFYNFIGSRSDEAIVLAQGGIIHGPYKKIAPGKYMVTYYGENLKNCPVEIKSENTQDYIKYELISQSDEEIKLELNVSNYVEDIQFYLINQDEDAVKFDRITIE